MKCPYCAEEIQSEARKCKHCGEWLEGGQRSQKKPNEGYSIPDYSSFDLYDCIIETADGKKHKEVELFARDEAQLVKIIEERYSPEYRLSSRDKCLKQESSKYSCPRCGSRYARCERDVGCAILIIIFISLGLGLIMIPFLPHKCECKACKHAWKS